MPRRSLVATLTRERLRTLAGDRTYDRGERYAHDGHVGDVAEDGGHLVAWVTGTHRYRAELRVAGSTIMSACTCPAADDGACCKHCVALGLQWIAAHQRLPTAAKRASQSTEVPAPRSAAKRALTMKDVRT
jgi:uncharacterized Zn finger protein